MSQKKLQDFWLQFSFPCVFPFLPGYLLWIEQSNKQMLHLLLCDILCCRVPTVENNVITSSSTWILSLYNTSPCFILSEAFAALPGLQNMCSCFRTPPSWQVFSSFASLFRSFFFLCVLDLSMEVTEVAHRHRNKGVVAVDLAGYEDAVPMEEHQKAFEVGAEH